MKIINRIFAFIYILISLISCSNKKEINSDSISIVPISPSREGLLHTPIQLWHKTEECICVLYGYGYNNSEFITNMNQKLYEQYGNYNEGGEILSLVFPDDFKRGSKIYISTLSDILEDLNVKAIILLGAPDGTSYAIGKLQDLYLGRLPFPVISLFSQDDVLGMEYSSDFVLDKAQKAEINGIITSEKTQDFIEEVPQILERSIFYADISDAPFEKNAQLFDIVKKVTGGLKTSRYADPETGLISINHFVLD